MWLNVHPFLFRHGVMLEDLPPATRQLGLRLLEASLSARGFAQARDIMRLNRLLAEVTGLPDDFGEWPYFLSFFGEPSADGRGRGRSTATTYASMAPSSVTSSC